MDNLGRDMERMMWALVVFGILAGAAGGFAIERLIRWIVR